MPSNQSRTIESILSQLGVQGFAGIGATGSGTTVTITVTPPAWAVLADGTTLTDKLASTTATASSTNGSYTLWLDYTFSAGDYQPVWSVAASAPSSNAIAIAAVTVSSNAISAVTVNPTGPTFPLSGAFQTTAPSAGGGSALPATPAGYVTVSVNGTNRKIAVY